MPLARGSPSAVGKKSKSKKQRRKELQKKLAVLPAKDVEKLEKLGRAKKQRKKLEKKVLELRGVPANRVEIEGRRAKKSCCGKPLARMCSRCPRRILVEEAVA
ncbi:MAG: hypothetical protein AAGA81_14270 [Acidobacteriota bacterium]